MLRGESGFTLLEILVASTLAALLGAILLASFTSSLQLPRQGGHERSAVAAQRVFEPLTSAVRWDTWNTPGAPLDTGMTHNVPVQWGLTATYTVAESGPLGSFDLDGDGEEEYRRVDVRIL